MHIMAKEKMDLLEVKHFVELSVANYSAII